MTRPLPPVRCPRAAVAPLTLALLAVVLAGCGADAPPTGPGVPGISAGPRRDADALATGAVEAGAVEGAVEAAAGGAAARKGTITITLVMRPEGAADVAFTTDSRKLRDFTLDDDANPTLPNTLTFGNVKPGRYAITMATAPDGPLTAIRCTSTGGADDNVVDVATRTVTLNVEAGEAVACTFVDGWKTGDAQTRSQGTWSATSDWYSAYDAVYASTFGIVEIGLAGTSGFSMRFSAPDRVANFLPQSGTAAALNVDLVDPTSSSSGGFGGQAVALRLNIDLSAAGFFGGASGVMFGGLTLCGMSDASLNGRSVAAVMDLVNTLLGGGTNGYTIPAITDLTVLLNAAFIGGEPSTLAQNHLFVGPCP